MSSVRLHVSGRIAELKLDNPVKLNAFTVEMLAQLAGHLDTIERNPDILCVVVTAAEARAFCSGADIEAWGDLSPAEFARHWVRGGHRIFDRLARLARPTIAALQAHAFGGGLELAAACDIRVMAPKATIALPEAGVGIVPGWSGTQRLARLLPEPVVIRFRRRGRGRCTRRRADHGGTGLRSVAARGRNQQGDDPRGPPRGPRRHDRSPRQRRHIGQRRPRRGRRRLPRQAQSHIHRKLTMTQLTLIPDSRAKLPDPRRNRHLIDGAWQDGQGATERLSPSHGTLVSLSPAGGEAEVTAAIAAARRAFDDGRWSRLPAKARAAVLLKVADLIEANTDRFALIETLESGKPITQARGEISGAADLWRFAASLARTLHGDSHNTLGEDMLGVILKEPIGVVSIITPWNFPFWILSQKLPFALAAGCTCVVKPSELTPSTTVMLGELLIEAGLPQGVVNIVLGLGHPVGSLMASHPDVDMVTFTGSTGVGRLIARNAAETLKKVALELGGKNPQVIFPDADLDSAADAVVFGVYFNGGQCCNSGSRILVHADIAEEFTARVVALSRKVAFGDPLDPRTQVGAIVTPAHQAKIDGYVKAALAEGARVDLGGDGLAIPGLKGQF